MKKILKMSVMLVAMCFLSTACDLTSNSDDNGNAEDEEEYTAPTTAFSKVLPYDLAVSSPTVTSTTEAEYIDATHDYQTKRELLYNIVTAVGSCAFSLSDYNFALPDCSRAPIRYENHPNDGTNGSTDGVNGIQNETEGEDQACITATLDQFIANPAVRIDNMSQIYAAMVCSANNANVDLPDAMGESVDLTSAMQAYALADGFEIVSATLEYLTNDADGNPVYVTAIAANVDFSQVNLSNSNETNPTQEITIILKHIPTSDDNSTYKGKLSYLMGHPYPHAETSYCDDMDDEAPKTFAGTLLYEKSSSTSIKYELNEGLFCGAVNPFDENNNIDIADGASEANPDGWGDDWYYILEDLNADTGDATIAFGWQDGYTDSARRIINATVDVGDDGAATGKAYFGFGGDWYNPGEMEVFYCNWDAPKGYITGFEDVDAISHFKVQYQEISRTSSAEFFMPVVSNITYAPSDDCTAAVGDGFTYWSEPAVDTVPGSFDNDRLDDSEDVTPDLIELGDMDFTMPERPSDV